ncbi:MAG: nuclear transport factor 2 family protein, partial [Candidatus Binatia bacterium]
MGAAENKEAIRTMFAEREKGNLEGFLGAMSDDVSFTVTGTTKFSGTFRGKQEVVGKLLSPLMAELEGGIAFTPESVIAEGDTVVVQARG